MNYTHQTHLVKVNTLKVMEEVKGVLLCENIDGMKITRYCSVLIAR